MSHPLPGSIAVCAHRRASVHRRFGASVIVACAMLVTAACQSVPAASPSPSDLTSVRQHAATEHPYVGMWVTADGRIRQELLPTGRYDEARAGRTSAYTGRYEVRDNHIDYWDDTGFTAEGTFVTDTELHHGGMIFYRQLP
ncbi:MAG: Atu4866 domain-containing protein [Mycobacterium sp.]